VIIKLEHGGRSYAYDDASLTVLQGIKVEEHIKGTLVDFDQGLGSHRSVCYQALGWLIFRDGDPKVPIAEVDFPITKLSEAWLQARLAVIQEMKDAVDAAEAEAAAPAPAKAPPPGPTVAPGSSPPSGSTSEPSPSSSGTGPQTSTGSASPSSTT